MSPETIASAMLAALGVLFAWFVHYMSRRDQLKEELADVRRRHLLDLYELQQMVRDLPIPHPQGIMSNTFAEEFSPLYGLRIVPCELACETRWEFPKERFVEYEPKDESWCRKLGIGREVIVGHAYRVGNVLYAHPTVIDAIKEQINERTRGSSKSG